MDLTRPTVYDKNQYALIKGLVDNLGRYKKSLTSDLVEEAEGLLIIAKIYLAAFENNPKIMEGHYSIALAPKKEKKRQETKSVKIEESSLQRQTAIESIKSALAYGVESFETTRNKWIEVGVVTREEINNLPYVKQSAQNSLRSAFNYGMDSFNTRKNEWIKAGVINEADAEIIRKSYGKK